MKFFKNLKKNKNQLEFIILIVVFLGLVIWQFIKYHPNELKFTKTEKIYSTKIIIKNENTIDTSNLESGGFNIDPFNFSDTGIVYINTLPPYESGDNYHVIVGSFKVPGNAEKFSEKLLSTYDKIFIIWYNGFECVSVYKHSDLEQSRNFKSLYEGEAWILRI
jgi:hypothetical protein